MPITLSCTCGKTLRVADEHAGRRVKCPACNAILTAPTPEPEFEVIEEQPRAKAVPPPGKVKPTLKPTVADDDEDEEDVGTYGLAGSGRAKNKDDDSGDENPQDKPLPDFRLGSGRHKGDMKKKKKK